MGNSQSTGVSMSNLIIEGKIPSTTKSKGRMLKAVHKKHRTPYIILEVSKKELGKEETAIMKEHVEKLSKMTFTHIQTICHFDSTGKKSIRMVLEDHFKDNLNSLLKRIYKIEPDLGIFIAFKITQGLKELRETGTVYRQLSTKSVLFKQQEGCPAIVKIADFLFDPKIRKFLEEDLADTTVFCTYKAPEVYDTSLP